MKILWMITILAFSSQAFSKTDIKKTSQNVTVSKPMTLTEKIDGFLKTYVSDNGGVDYIAINKKFSDLEKLLYLHKEIKMKELSRQYSENEKLATYINLYNIGMIYNVLKYMNSKKFRLTARRFYRRLDINNIKISGKDIWSGEYTLPLGTLKVNLNDIEHKLIRGVNAGSLSPYKVEKLDPRIHAAVNCAAISCPKLSNSAYTPEKVQSKLQRSMVDFLSSNEQIQKKSLSTMRANKILYWYYDDFDNHGKKLGLKGAGGYLSQFINPKAKDSKWKQQFFKNKFNNRSKAGFFFSSDFDFHYDWRPNDSRNLK